MDVSAHILPHISLLTLLAPTLNLLTTPPQIVPEALEQVVAANFAYFDIFWCAKSAQNP